ncbi:MAG: OB-fold nucleic acid binding domain-containing protein, partial [Desulfosalsimonas sp.]
KNGLDDGRIADIWKMIMSFNGYSFCKPHSASYARVSFQAAWLKAWFPAEFMAAVISNQGGFYSTFAYISEAMRIGLTVMPPDVLKSRIRWTGSKSSLRVGLMSIRDLSDATRNRIIKERSQAEFADAEDFFTRVQPGEQEARALVFSGAADSFHPKAHRGAVLWRYYKWRKTRELKNTGSLLFAEAGFPANPDLPEQDRLRRLRRQYAALGFLCGRHPMTLFSDHPEVRKSVKAERMAGYAGRRIRLAGWLITGKTILSKKGDPMKFVTFEDETGIFETVFFPKVFARFFHLVEPGYPYLVSGRAQMNHGAMVVSADSVRQLKFSSEITDIQCRQKRIPC